MGKLLDRKKLLAKEECKIERVELENGDHVFVRQMSGRDRDRWESSILKKVTKDNVVTMEQNLEDFRAKLAVATVCDEAGNLLLLPEDVPILSQNMTARSLETIVTAAQKLNKITEEDKENLTKNSEADPAGNSTSD